jgi:hypothetical protein
LTRDATDAEDLVAETVATAWAKLQDLRDPQRFELRQRMAPPPLPGGGRGRGRSGVGRR